MRARGSEAERLVVAVLRWCLFLLVGSQRPPGLVGVEGLVRLALLLRLVSLVVAERCVCMLWCLRRLPKVMLSVIERLDLLFLSLRRRGRVADQVSAGAESLVLVLWRCLRPLLPVREPRGLLLMSRRTVKIAK